MSAQTEELGRAAGGDVGRGLRAHWRWLWTAQGPSEQGTLEWAREFERRARLAFELSRYIDAGGVGYGPGEGQALELVCQGIYWALRSHALDALSREGAEGEVAEPGLDYAVLWRMSDSALLGRAAGSSAALAKLERICVEGSFASRAALPAVELGGELALARGFAERLLASLPVCGPSPRERARLRARRKAFAVLLGVGALGMALNFGVARFNRYNELSYGKPWQASSHFEGHGCSSPEQDCPGQPVFFHTVEEEDPSLLIDLGEVSEFTRVKVVNRPECCQERALPLVVEVSQDNQHFERVAERTEAFETWTARFSKVSARWVRLHVPRRTFFHLKQVRVLR